MDKVRRPEATPQPCELTVAVDPQRDGNAGVKTKDLAPVSINAHAITSNRGIENDIVDELISSSCSWREINHPL